MKKMYLGVPLTSAQKKMRRDIYREENRDVINNKLKVYRSKNKEFARLSHRKTYFKINHNLTIEQAEQLLASQNGCCAICKKPTFLGGKGGAKIDHCHNTDEIRGILCSTCNTGLGHFKDNMTILFNAINYLRAFQKRGEGEIGVSG